MAEYIEREAVLNLPQSITRNFVGEVVERSIDVEDVKNLPAADVVPVVRCRDCKHLENRDEEGGKCWRGNGFARAMENDDYCSYGERRNEA